MNKRVNKNYLRWSDDQTSVTHFLNHIDSTAHIELTDTVECKRLSLSNTGFQAKFSTKSFKSAASWTNVKEVTYLDRLTLASSFAFSLPNCRAF